MNFTIIENPTEIKPCIQQVQEQIFVDENGIYRIPPDLKIVDYPEEVVNSFLDFINQFEGVVRDNIIKMIKEGIMTVESREED